MKAPTNDDSLARNPIPPDTFLGHVHLRVADLERAVDFRYPTRQALGRALDLAGLLEADD